MCQLSDSVIFHSVLKKIKIENMNNVIFYLVEKLKKKEQ